jgi:CubicO group peptidase (beta-lactamase class C family)
VNLSGTKRLLEEGIDKGWQLGAQIYVSLGGITILDLAVGEARSGIPMRTDSIIQWFSAGKPITAVAIAQLWEAGKIELNEPIAEVIPEFPAAGKAGITAHHLLTHTAGIRLADKLSPQVPWDEMIQRICETPIEKDWIPGERAGYSTAAAWYVLAEIVQRLSGQTITGYIRDWIFRPAGMSDSWLCLPPAEYDRYGDRVAIIYDSSAATPKPAEFHDRDGMSILRPGSSARGPVRELGRFYEMLLKSDSADRLVTTKTLDYFTRRHRVGLYDQTFFHAIDFGLGFLINSNRYGVETVPYGYGRHASERTFGHSGAQSSCGFADPEHDLVVAWVANGMPGEKLHQHRARELNSAIYKDLDLA